jgi:hypothetical protein
MGSQRGGVTSSRASIRTASTLDELLSRVNPGGSVGVGLSSVPAVYPAR